MQIKIVEVKICSIELSEHKYTFELHENYVLWNMILQSLFIAAIRKWLKLDFLVFTPLFVSSCLSINYFPYWIFAGKLLLVYFLLISLNRLHNSSHELMCQSFKWFVVDDCLIVVLEFLYILSLELLKLSHFVYMPNVFIHFWTFLAHLILIVQKQKIFFEALKLIIALTMLEDCQTI